ncbi:MAG: L,D-transpeptidase family protein [Acidobacteriaceae bacterium]
MSIPRVAAQSRDEAVANDLRAIGQQGKLPDLRWPNFSDYRQPFQHVYEATNYSPLWLQDGHPTGQAYIVLHALETSAAMGLDPEDYDSSRWNARLLALKTTGKNNPDVLAHFDAALTVGAMRYISDLHIGRVNPRHFHFGIDIKQKKYDLPHFLLNNVIHADNVQSVLNQVEPPYEAYQRTKAALQTYLKIQQEEQQQNAESPLPIPPKMVKPGGTYRGIAPLAQRLRLLGDLPQNAPVDAASNKYDRALVEAVIHFQGRHGLPENGNLGKDTFRALNTPIGMRVLQLEDALERWRWLPPEYAVPPIVVNIPEFVLRVIGDNKEVIVQMKVVVGKAYNHQTPIFTKDMKYIVFRPYWNVPQSIVRAEILPALRKNRNYLAQKQFEVTDLNGHVLSEGGVSTELLAQMRVGKVLVRQKPGPENALGLVKFLFPNDDNVYLHSTPAPQLFSQSRRDFSHGCVRVEKPVELAVWLLRDQPQWNLDSIQAAMESGPNNHWVNLTQPVPVLIFYLTALAGRDGQVHFFDDIYGLDQSLNQVLSKGRPYPQ